MESWKKESNPREALKREILEELGCEIDVQQLLGKSEVLVGKRIIAWMLIWHFVTPEVVLNEHLAGEWITQVKCMTLIGHLQISHCSMTSYGTFKLNDL